MNRAERLGTAPIRALLKEQAIPASIGVLVMSIYGIVDTIFVGQFIGTIAIAAITIIIPIVVLMGSFGMAIGIAGSSIISRALGEKNYTLAKKTFANQILILLAFSCLILILGWIFQDAILQSFGGKGDILPVAKVYFQIVLFSFPFFSWMIMSNTVIRAEGKPKIAMKSMLVPALINLFLDPILIVGFDMGIEGAAWATAFGYIISGLFTLWYFLSKKAILKLRDIKLSLDLSIVKEIFFLGSVTFARHSVISVLAIVLNNSLFIYGGAISISVYGIIQRVMMFANFPANGIIQGFLPIAGFNFGAKKWLRVKDSVIYSIKGGTIIAFILFIIIIVFAPQITKLFTNESELINLTIPALKISFLATPLILFQLISSAYYQAIGKAKPALLLALTKQGFFLLPLLLIMPLFFGLNGIWMSFPIADVLSAAICYYYLKKGIKSSVGD